MIEATIRTWIGRSPEFAKQSYKQKLARYSRSPDMIEKTGITCGFYNCGGRFLLRGDADIYYRFPNGSTTERSGKTGFTSRSTIGLFQHGGDGEIITVTLHLNGKRLLAVGPLKGDPGYPYPAEADSQETPKFMETASRLRDDGTRLYTYDPHPYPDYGTDTEYFDVHKRRRALVLRRNDNLNAKRLVRVFDRNGKLILEQEFDVTGKVQNERATFQRPYGASAIVYDP